MLGYDIRGIDACASAHVVAATTMGAQTVPESLSEAGAWQLADGVLFSVVSSLVLWSILLASLYRALI